MAKRQLPLFRIGDRIKIVRPDFFVRCGYPLDYQETCEKVAKEHGQQVAEFLESFDLRAVEYQSSAGSIQSKPFVKVIQALAYGMMRRDNFGGRERKIYTVTLDQHAMVTTEVIGQRYVKTGTYSPGCRRGGYDGDEYDPPYLSKEKTHRLLETTLPVHDEGMLQRNLWHLWIETTNVEKVVDD